MGANIESLETQASSAPFTGAPMFALNMRVGVPPQLSLSELRSKLQAVCDEVNQRGEFLTAYAGEESRAKALAAGFEEHLAKPAEPQQLLAAVARLVGRRPPQL